MDILVGLVVILHIKEVMFLGKILEEIQKTIFVFTASTGTVFQWE